MTSIGDYKCNVCNYPLTYQKHFGGNPAEYNERN